MKLFYRIVLFLSFLPATLIAEEEATSPDWLDRRSIWVSDRVDHSSSWLDLKLHNMFCRKNGERLENHPGPGHSYLRLSPFMEMLEYGDPEFRVRSSGKLDLPLFDHRFSLIFEDRLDEDEVLDRPGDREALPGMQTEDEADKRALRGMGLRYSFKPGVHWKTRAKAAVRFYPEPRPRFRLRSGIKHGTDNYQTGFSQSVFWTDGKGFGEKSEFSGTYCWSDWSLHGYSSYIFSETSRGVDWGQSVALRYWISDHHRIGPHITVQGRTHPGLEAGEIRSGIVYRKRLGRNWIYLELQPGLRWLEESSYKTEVFGQLQLDLLFGNGRNDYRRFR